ncbi:hypothetical protein [Nibrella viscosa]|uniref:hypothetical protein n=1 Tax=Nibrella viscosa TaxID=1084524 RepID=UPI0031E89B1C
MVVCKVMQGLARLLMSIALIVAFLLLLLPVIVLRWFASTQPGARRSGKPVTS